MWGLASWLCIDQKKLVLICSCKILMDDLGCSFFFFFFWAAAFKLLSHPGPFAACVINQLMQLFLITCGPSFVRTLRLDSITSVTTYSAAAWVCPHPERPCRPHIVSFLGKSLKQTDILQQSSFSPRSHWNDVLIKTQTCLDTLHRKLCKFWENYWLTGSPKVWVQLDLKWH